MIVLGLGHCISCCSCWMRRWIHWRWTVSHRCWTRGDRARAPGRWWPGAAWSRQEGPAAAAAPAAGSPAASGSGRSSACLTGTSGSGYTNNHKKTKDIHQLTTQGKASVLFIYKTAVLIICHIENWLMCLYLGESHVQWLSWGARNTRRALKQRNKNDHVLK